MNIKDIARYVATGTRVIIRANSTDTQPIADIRIGRLKEILEDTIVIEKFPESDSPKETDFKCNIEGTVMIPASSIQEIMII